MELLLRKKTVFPAWEKILWALFTVSVIFGSALPGIGIPGAGELYPFRVLLLVCMVLSIPHIRKMTKIQASAVIMFVAVICYGALSVSWSTDKIVAIKSLSNYIIMFLLVIVLAAFFNERKRMDYFLACCCLILFVLQILGIVESVTGRYFFDVNEKWLTIRNEIGLWSPMTVFDNTNDLIFVLVGFQPFYFMTVNRLCKKSDVLRLSAKAVYVLLTCYLAYAAQCRMGLLLSIAVLFLYLLFGKCRKYFKPVAAIAVVFIVCTSPWWVKIIQTEARWGIWMSVLKSAQHFFFLGVGIGNSYIAVPGVEYTATLSNPHFWFLEIFADFGFVIFGLVLAWFIYVVVRIWKLLRADKKNYRLQSALVFLCIFVPLSMMCSSIAAFNMFYVFMCLVISIADESARCAEGRRVADG